MGGGLVLGIGLAALVSTCTGSDAARSVAADASFADQCDSVPDGAHRLTVTAGDGARLGGAVGRASSEQTGSPVVVLRHGASHTLCDWLDRSAAISQETGADVVLLDRRSQGSSPGDADLSRDPSDALSALDAATQADLVDPATAVVVMGSSMGNASAFTLAAQLPRPACVVVGVSPVPVTGPLDGVATLASSGPRSPERVHLTWATDDGKVPAHVATLRRAADSAGVTVTTTEVDGDAHARAVLDQHEDAQRSVVEAISACS